MGLTVEGVTPVVRLRAAAVSLLVRCAAITAGGLLLTPAHAAPAALERFQYTQLEMGTQARIIAYAPSEAAAKRACVAAFKVIADQEQIMSDYRPSSELSRLCDQAGGPPVPVSRELFDVLNHAHKLAERSAGAFDPTVAPLVALWRSARRAGALPDPADLAAARRRVGFRMLRLDPLNRTVQLAEPGMRLDLGGIAKGYAEDDALRAMRRLGVRSALIEMGGDIVAGDPPPGQPGWRVEVAAAGPEAPGRIITVANCAVSSSGDTEQFVEIGGRRYSHIVDPRTGLGLTDRIAVTIVARRGRISDGLSTAVSVLGAAAGARLLAAYPGATASIRTAR